MQSPLMVRPANDQIPDLWYRQKSRYVSYGTFGTGICLWSSNRQINVCFPLKSLKKKRKKVAHNSVPQASSGGAGGVALDADE